MIISDPTLVQFHARALGDVGGSELPGETNHFLTVRHQAMQARLQQDSRHRRNHRGMYEF